MVSPVIFLEFNPLIDTHRETSMRAQLLTSILRHTLPSPRLNFHNHASHLRSRLQSLHTAFTAFRLHSFAFTASPSRLRLHGASPLRLHCQGEVHDGTTIQARDRQAELQQGWRRMRLSGGGDDREVKCRIAVSAVEWHRKQQQLCGFAVMRRQRCVRRRRLGGAIAAGTCEGCDDALAASAAAAVLPVLTPSN